MTFNLVFYYFISITILFIGFLGLILGRNNSFLLLISIEILFLAINFNFLMSSLFFDDIGGSIFTIFILAISGSEIIVGLALYILIYRVNRVLLNSEFINLKG